MSQNYNNNQKKSGVKEKKQEAPKSTAKTVTKGDVRNPLDNRSEANRHVMAGYVNLARQNLYITLKHIAHLLGDNSDVKEDGMRNFAFLRNLNTNALRSEKALKVTRLLDKHFPFLPGFFEFSFKSEKNTAKAEKKKMSSEKMVVTPKMYKDTIELIIDTLNAMRNEFTHNNPINSWDNDTLKQQYIIAISLGLCFDKARREAKTRFGFTDNDLDFLTNQEVKYRDKIGKDGNPVYARDEKGKIKYNNTTAIIVKEERDEWYYSIKRYADAKLLEHRSVSPDRCEPLLQEVTNDGYRMSVLSDVGEVFFISLFLHKRYAKEMMDKLKVHFDESLPENNTELPQSISDTLSKIAQFELEREAIKRKGDNETLHKIDKNIAELNDSKNSLIAMWNADLVKKKEQARNLQKKILFEIMTLDRIRLPKGRIESQSEDCALGLDMLNELQRCPRELFETLSPTDQNKFRILPEEGSDGMETLMMRYSDRFPYFAMSYIDQVNALGGMRFQLSLGKYRYAFYEKQCVDSESADRVRSLQVELNGFGKPSEVDKKRHEEWSTLIREFSTEISEDTLETAPYITDHRPRYVVNNNRIGLLWNDATSQPLRNGIYLPEIHKFESNPGKDVLAKDADGKRSIKPAAMLAPACWLSTYELPALLFLHFLTKDDAKDDANKVQSIIRVKVEAYRALFKGIRDGEITPQNHNEKLASLKLSINDLPDKLRDYLKSKSVDVGKKLDNHINTAIDKMFKAAEMRLKKFKEVKKLIGTKDNKIGSDRHKSIKIGTLASILAEEIMSMQNPLGKKRMTGANYSALQSSLAMYPGYDAMQRIFVSCGLIGGDYPHPFLQKVMDKKPNNLQDFYEEYWKVKIESKNIWAVKDNAIFYQDRVRWQKRNLQWYKSLAERYLSQPVELPRGLFDEEICKQLSEQFEDMKSLIDSTKRHNTAFLITKFFEKCKADSSQGYYEFDRHYDYFDKLIYKVDGNKLLPQYLSESDRVAKVKQFKKKKSTEVPAYINRKCEKINKDVTKIPDKELDEIQTAANAQIARMREQYDDNEKQIRRHKVQDIIIFLMSRELLLKVGKTDRNGNQIGNQWQRQDTYKLRDITPGGNENILNLKLPFEMTLNVNGNEIKIRQEDLKLKNYGDFYSFIYDDRVMSLLSSVVLTDNTIMREDLEEELMQYDLKRSDVFYIVHRIEKNVMPELEKRLKDGSITQKVYEDARNSFRELLKYYQQANNEEREKLIQSRNAYGHNHYPDWLTDAEVRHAAESILQHMTKVTGINPQKQ